ncbi:predicted zinc finger protein [Trypanosoma brucei gambiense DAL972]|uniref:Zinc finger protein, putative n=1 Tax=Trypanosoma brucei gambiense (strain MHOM/CI/86/DAL972) TaxID=679716 RepID=D0AAH9_TRYB9|nr:predicted zinc finger protein [Trypanosoma brucei gambiense DAL972]CBH18680.1 predicted zinc finger protein [Trypanosoma brucei gambiense DAL972]|eukprot:XP_011780944.1 predicted zinc finger protein [Trypanosoma brucei gambiense DAL972]
MSRGADRGVTVEMIREAATALMRKMEGGHVDLLPAACMPDAQGDALSTNVSSGSGLESLSGVYERYLCGGSGHADERYIPREGVDSADGNEWLDLLADISDAEIDAAVANLASERRAQYEEQYRSGNDAGFVLINKGSGCSPSGNVDPTQSGEEVENIRRAGGDCSVHQKADENILYFGGIVELTHSCEWRPDMGGATDGGVYTFDHQKDSAPLEPDFGSNPSTDSTHIAAPVPEITREGLSSSPHIGGDFDSYVRDKVRLQLLVDRVAERAREIATREVLGSVREAVEGRDDRVRRYVKRNEEIRGDLVHLLVLMRQLHRQAIADHAGDPFRVQPWERDESVTSCNACSRSFTHLVRRHHCRRCGLIYCHDCSSFLGKLPDRAGCLESSRNWVRVCEGCYTVCCEHRRYVNSIPPPPPPSCHEREGNSPKDPCLSLPLYCKNGKGTLTDGMPPFYVVLPEESYSPSTTVLSLWANALYKGPHRLFGLAEDGAAALYRISAPKFQELLTSTIGTVKSISGYGAKERWK